MRLNQAKSELLRLGLAADALDVDKLGEFGMLEDVMASTNTNQSEPKRLDQRNHLVKANILAPDNAFSSSFLFFTPWRPSVPSNEIMRHFRCDSTKLCNHENIRIQSPDAYHTLLSENYRDRSEKMDALKATDEAVWQAIKNEERRQLDGLEMIASENIRGGRCWNARGRC